MISCDVTQVLAGDLEEAICLHAIYYAIWQRFNALPERYNWQLRTPEVLFYPLRPEFVESTYYLYRATQNPFYLHVGMEIVQSLNNYTKVEWAIVPIIHTLKSCIVSIHIHFHIQTEWPECFIYEIVHISPSFKKQLLFADG